MKIGILKIASITAAVISSILLLINVLFYKNISESIQIIRGVFIQKTFFMAIRILLINITTLGLCYWLIKVLIQNGKEKEIEIPGTILLIIVILKTVIEASGMFVKEIMDNSLYILVPILLIGFLFIYWKGKNLFKREFWKTITTNKSNLWSVVGLVMVYIVLNIPVIMILRRK